MKKICQIAGAKNRDLRTANLNDKRLNQRFADVLRSLSKHPQISIPTVCGGHAETTAAYTENGDKMFFLTKRF